MIRNKDGGQNPHPNVAKGATLERSTRSPHKYQCGSRIGVVGRFEF